MQQVLWFLVTIGILIPIHEYGHYRVAVACNVKVLRFSVGVGRVLWSRRLGKDGTEFALSMLPLGGYVRMLDEREAAVDGVDAPRAFNRQSLPRRAAIVAAGPLANLLLAIVLYAFVQWYGQDEAAPVASTPLAGSLMADAGLRSGDRVLATAVGAAPGEDDWEDVRSFNDVYDALGQAMLDRQPLQMRVKNAASPTLRTLKVAVDSLDPDQAGGAGYARLGLGSQFAAPRISEVVPGSPAAAAGVQPGDLVTQVDGRAIPDAQVLREMILATARAPAAGTMQWSVSRDGRPLTLAVTPRLEGQGAERVARVGVGFGAYEHVLVREDALDALRLGALQTWRMASSSLRMFGRMLSGQASLKNLSGPGTIAEVASNSAHQGLAPFLAFLAFVSVSLAVLNLLPIPVLDGGTLLYYLFEGATGRPVSELWQVWLQRGGILAILLLMSIALSNDVARHLGLQ